MEDSTNDSDAVTISAKQKLMKTMADTVVFQRI